MAEPINLNKARKARAKGEAQSAAAANRARFGRTKAEKAAEQLKREAARKLLDGAQLAHPSSPASSGGEDR
ncbi:DUF4169 family protein [Phenylobacterium sp.]|jgi:hypothetical protein|uniref:DUF4169 family protein n=1 Tax=Phenylobacterium sp. TaxID=1871053 RepID=UPI002F3ED132